MKQPEQPEEEISESEWNQRQQQLVEELKKQGRMPSFEQVHNDLREILERLTRTNK